MIKYFALVADSDVFYILPMDEDNPIGAKWSAALQSNIKFVKINNFAQVKPGFFYKNNIFYESNDKEMSSPIIEQTHTNEDEYKYAGIIDNDVIGILTIIKSVMGEQQAEMIDAGIQSNPIVVEYTNNPKRNIITAGWTWDGTDFILLEE